MMIALPAAAAGVSAVGVWLLLRDAGRDAPDARGAARVKAGMAALSPRAAAAYAAFTAAACIGAALALTAVYPDNTFIFNMRRLCLLSLLLPAAFVDYKSYRIPNAFIVAGAAYWAALFIAEPLVSGMAGFGRTAVSDLAAAGALTAAALLCAVAIRGSIGAGDVKLFMVMGLLLSTEGIGGAVLLSLAVSFIVSAWLLITKRKTRKDTLPFAPALAAGTFLSVLLTGM
ncbi:MAG: A24 family peptidase [Oscillospiraceae bacterium]|jgi:leader peptidase (prepilin peptidase)/N-methyltransferase|nr:A24 family peptidase [Oscillospiraceae bacterium]